jgi:hypothetical protein
MWYPEEDENLGNAVYKALAQASQETGTVYGFDFTIGAGLAFTVDWGSAMYLGHAFFSNQLVSSIAPNATGLDRVDIIVTKIGGGITIKQGVAAGHPFPPEVDEDEIPLYRVTVPDGVTQILASHVKDIRIPFYLKMPITGDFLGTPNGLFASNYWISSKAAVSFGPFSDMVCITMGDLVAIVSFQVSGSGTVPITYLDQRYGKHVDANATAASVGGAMLAVKMGDGQIKIYTPSAASKRWEIWDAQLNSWPSSSTTAPPWLDATKFSVTAGVCRWLVGVASPNNGQECWHRGDESKMYYWDYSTSTWKSFTTFSGVKKCVFLDKANGLIVAVNSTGLLKYINIGAEIVTSGSQMPTDLFSTVGEPLAGISLGNGIYLIACAERMILYDSANDDWSYPVWDSYGPITYASMDIDAQGRVWIVADWPSPYDPPLRQVLLPRKVGP